MIYYWRGAVGEAAFLEAHQETLKALVEGTYAKGDLEMLHGHRDVFSYRTSDRGRLLFTTIEREGQRYLLLLEHLPTHDYHKSRFLRPGILKRYLLSHEEGMAEAVLLFNPLDVVPPMLQGLTIDDKKPIALAYYHQTFIQLSDLQQEALCQPLPAVISGTAGSGKSCVGIALLSDAVNQHQALDNPEPRVFLYVAESPLLVRELEDAWRELPIAQDLDNITVRFMTEEALHLMHSNLDGLTAVGQANFHAWFLTHKARIDGFDLSEDVTYQEFRICSAYSLEDYSALGRQQSSLEKGPLREKLYQAYLAYQKHLLKTRAFHPAFHPIDVAERYHLIVVDESQDLSHLQLKNIAGLAINRQIACCMDSHQSLSDVQSKRPFLLQLLGGKDNAVSHVELPVTYRCPLKIAHAADVLIQAKYHLTGGIADKKETPTVMPHSNANMGHLFTLKKEELNSWAWLKQQAQGTHFAVVTSLEYIEEARTLFPKDRVFTPKDIKGLEYDTVVVFRPFSPSRFKEAYQQLQGETGDTPILHRAKADVGDNTFGPDFNQLITAFTRAKRTLVICEESTTRQAQFLLKPFQDIMGQALLQSAECEKDTTEADWEAEILRIASRGDMKRALGVYCRKFQCGDVGFNAFLARHQQQKTPSVPITATGDAPKVNATADRPSIVSEPLKKQSPEASPKKPAVLKITPSDAVKPLTRDEQQIVNLLNDFSEKRLLVWLKLVELPKCLTEINVSFGTPPLRRSLLNHLTNDAEKTSLFVTCLANNADLFQKAKLTQCAKPLKKGDNGPCLDEAKTKLINLVALKQAFRDRLAPAPFLQQNITLAHIAAQWGFVAVLTKLSELGIDMNKAAADGATPAYVAAKNGHVAVLAKLHELGADINITTINGATPAHIAAAKGYIAVLEKLHELGADMNQATTDGITLAHIAAAKGYVAMLEKLQELGADMNKSRANGETPAYLAAQAGQVAVLVKLNELGADMNKAKANGETPTHIAAQNGHLEAITYLFDILSHTEAFGIPLVSSKELLLMYCKHQDSKTRPEITRRMCLKIDERLTHGDATNSIVLLPIDIAEVMGHDKIVEMLRKHQPSPRVSSSFFNHLPQIPSAPMNAAKNDFATTRL